jgi:hypothetical protein
MQWSFSCAALNRKNRFDIVEVIKVRKSSASVSHAIRVGLRYRQ